AAAGRAGRPGRRRRRSPAPARPRAAPAAPPAAAARRAATARSPPPRPGRARPPPSGASSLSVSPLTPGLSVVRSLRERSGIRSRSERTTLEQPPLAGGAGQRLRQLPLRRADREVAQLRRPQPAALGVAVG